MLSRHRHLGFKKMLEKQRLEATAKAEELDIDLEASLRTCHHIIAEYRAMLIAALKENAEPVEVKGSD